MVADAIVYHPSVTHYLQFVATTVGRDKLLRTLQYFARFYAWYLMRTHASPASSTSSARSPPPLVGPWEAMKKQFGTARKLLRVGKNVEHFKAAAVAADTKNMDPMIRYTTVGRQLGYAGYLSADLATVLDATGIRKWEGAKKLQTEAYRFWAFGLVCSLVGQVYTLNRLRQREASLDRKDGEGAVESKRLQAERTASLLQIVSDACDLTIPTTALGWVKLEDGLVGLAGTLSSLIGIYTQWKKTG